jgi:hypothetical protein
MDDEQKNSMIIGFSIGFSTFIGLVIIFCLIWNYCCGRFCFSQTKDSDINIRAVKKQPTGPRKQPIRRTNLNQVVPTNTLKEICGQSSFVTITQNVIKKEPTGNILLYS